MEEQAWVFPYNHYEVTSRFGVITQILNVNFYNMTQGFKIILFHETLIPKAKAWYIFESCLD